ncbi:esterase-like activity of phytase family protein [Crocosphaera sp. UHCC 0190]|uniref:esterase-like activity of phytase family protein n=1 Tax=Crocosphaera sp. UHCC 0190 TaxID=3110246 RepID=UPI002B1FBA8A|nr:esterase-like activity of phytase family protein [Crocosphaera sp. UHCC 0190]MEA5509158.1 esterase-like activity of phytase family protein [Crocosphaera sp. UHCC 0190]
MITQSNALASELVGRAVLDANTFAPGPTSGQFIAPSNGFIPPFVNQEPVQGFSAILPGPTANTYRVMEDNGFGSKANSADSVLRFYTVEIDFNTGEVFAANWQTGARLPSFTEDSILQLNDQNNLINFDIVADLTNYPNSAIPVDANIVTNRWLTGADFDIESFREAPDGTFWVGDEFGPFLLHFSADGTLLEAPISIPNLLGLDANPFVQSPDNPNLTTANLPRSRGFEGMAINTSGTKLYPLLEGPLTSDPQRDRLLIYEYDLATSQFTGNSFNYRLENPTETGQAIGDLTAISDTEFLVIERDGKQGDPNNPLFSDPAQFKRIYKININEVDQDGFVKKELLVDLLDIADPNNIGGNGTTDGIFTFPFVTIEAILPIDKNTLLITNDNNFPFSVGRTPGQADNNEFILVSIASVPESNPSLGLLLLGGLGLILKTKKPTKSNKD